MYLGIYGVDTQRLSIFNLHKLSGGKMASMPLCLYLSLVIVNSVRVGGKLSSTLQSEVTTNHFNYPTLEASAW